MYKKPEFTYIIFLLLLLSGCHADKFDTLKRFETIYEIESKSLNIDHNTLYSYGKMILMEDKNCILKENHIGNSLLDIIYYKKDSINSLISKGDAPNESSMINLMQAKDSLFWVLDIHKKRTMLKDTDGNTTYYQNLDNFVHKATKTNNGYIVSGVFPESDESKRYVRLNEDGQFIDSFGDYPQDGITTSPLNKLLAYQGRIVYNAYSNKIASICFHGSIFEIYELNKSPKAIKIQHDIFPSYQPYQEGNITGTTHGPDNLFGYLDIYATKQYIYTLYSGKKIDQLSAKSLQKASLANKILVYDWDGNPICILQTDIDLFNICVSQDNKMIIGLGWENDDYQLKYYDIKIPQ